MPKAISRCVCCVFSSVLFFVLCANAAIAQISPGVTQSAAHTANITGAVVESDGTPVAGADVKLSGPTNLSSKSDARGDFNFSSVPWGTYQIIVTSRFGLASRNNVAVNGDIKIAIQYQARGSLRTIAQVSTSSAGASINVSPASIASVNPSDYAFQGNASWKELLSQIPGVTVGGNLSGGYTPYVTIPNTPFQPVVLSVNGALPYETSTTLDGMPLYNTTIEASFGPGSGTDLSYLPMPVFDTADVVRGPGANAPTIVDSIGGSFVMHPPTPVAKDHFEFSASNDAYGGMVSNLKAELRFGRFSATIVDGVNNSPGPLENQGVIPAISYAPLTIGGNPLLSGGFTGFSPNPIYGLNCACNIKESLLYCCVPVDTGWSQHNGAIALSYDIAPSVIAQIFYAGSSARMQQPQPGFPVDFVPGPGYTGSIAPGLHNYIEDAGPISIAQASSLIEEKITASLGRSVVRLAALQNNSFTKQVIPGFFPASGQYTVWGTGSYGTSPPGAPVVFNGTSENLAFDSFSEDTRLWVNNRDLLLSYATQVGNASSLGVSYVTSYYNSPDSSHFAFDGVPFSSSQSSATSETTRELRIQASDQVSDKLSLNASWYFADGSFHMPKPTDPTGSTYTNADFPYNAPRFGIVWRAGRDSAIRLAAGGGYALPPIFYFTGNGPNPTPSCGIGSCSVTITNLHLQPETSFGLDLGTDLRFHQDTVLSVDLYRTNLYGQFFQSTNLTGTFAGLPLYTTQYANLSQSRFYGVNLDIAHNASKGIYWHGALGLTRAYVVSVPSGFYAPSAPGGAPQNTYIVPGINFDGQFQSTVPYATGTAQLGYRWAPGSYIDLSPTYYGKNNPYFEPAFVELNAHAGVPLTRNVSLLATFRNITGIYDQSYSYIFPTLGAPTVTGMPYALFGIPYGPRSAVFTLNFNY